LIQEGMYQEKKLKLEEIVVVVVVVSK
jgi:hypothetical protein